LVYEGIAVWITGLPGSGKSTVTDELERVIPVSSCSGWMNEKGGYPTTYSDRRGI
jgi:broad-specificity NMP kinase